MARQRQRALFDLNPATVAPSVAADSFARVVFNRPLRTIFTYAVPETMTPELSPGKRVMAPFGKGNRKTVGYCVGVDDQAPRSTLKSLIEVIDDAPILSDTMLELTRWIADTYFCGWGQVLEAVLPAGVKHQKGTRWAIFYQARTLDPDDLPELTVKQRRAWDALIAFGRPATVQEICEAARCGQACVRELRVKGAAEVVRKRVFHRPPVVRPVAWDKPLTLNDRQASALERIIRSIDRAANQTFLLHGVTGSGKTEVYLQAIARTLDLGRQAIVLVPEISLTPQTIERFRKRFGLVAVLHSQLSDAERAWHWKRIAAGEVDVVIGARSAIFAPCPSLGLVVIDEEHETTFKQENTPRYHAREVAIERARRENAVVVLGSATPSLESFWGTRTGKLELLELPERVNARPLPKVEIIDLRTEHRGGRGFAAISMPMARAMHDALASGGQVMLLLNRRGFATSILCPRCGFAATCKHCDVALTLHKDLGQLLCHSCDTEFPAPSKCPECGELAIRHAGLGTERVHEEVMRRFPRHRCERMDSDTMRSHAHYETALAAFRKGETHILLGTQMIAKGLDFPNVKLVGVISADTARSVPDFRATERTFQLIAQVAGRTGRGDEPGRVLVQTYVPEDRAIKAAAAHDYHRFVGDELPVRHEFGYPPTQALTRIIVRAPQAQEARDAIELIAKRLRVAIDGNEEIRVLGPAPAPIARLKDNYRFHLQLHTPDTTDRAALLEKALGDIDLPATAEYAVDVDPVSML